MRIDHLKKVPSQGQPLCASCGAPILPHANFCRHCGARVASGLPPVVCPNCHASVPAGAKFCRECGQKLETVQQSVPDIPPVAEGAASGVKPKKRRRKKKVITNCPKCGAAVAPRTKKCPQCGKRLKKRHPFLITACVFLGLILLAYGGLQVYFAMQAMPQYEKIPENDYRFMDWEAEHIPLNPEPMVFGDLESDGFRVEIPAGALPADLELEVSGYDNVSINAVGYEDQFFTVMQPIRYTFKLHEIPTEEEARYYVCTYTDGDIGEQTITPDWDRLLEGYVEFETYHFSDYQPKKLEIGEFAAAKARKAAANTYMHMPWGGGSEALDQESQEIAETFGKAVGLTREDSLNVYREVISMMGDMGSFTDTGLSFYEAAAQGDMDTIRTMVLTKMSDAFVGVCQKQYEDIRSLDAPRANAAKNMAKMHPEAASTWGSRQRKYADLAKREGMMIDSLEYLKVAEKVAVLSEAAGTAAFHIENEEYMKATEVVGKAVATELLNALGNSHKIARIGIEAWLSGTDFFLNETMESEYQRYKDCAGRYDKTDWENTFEGMNGWFHRGAYPTLLRRVRENYCKSAGLTMEELETQYSKIWDDLDTLTKNKIKSRFAQRLEREDEISALTERYEIFLQMAEEQGMVSSVEGSCYNRIFKDYKSVDDQIVWLCRTRDRILEMTGNNVRRFGRTPQRQEEWLLTYAQKWLQADSEAQGRSNMIRYMAEVGHIKPGDELYKEYVQTELEQLLGVYHGRMKFQKASISDAAYQKDFGDDEDMSKGECDSIYNAAMKSAPPSYRGFRIEDKDVENGLVWICADMYNAASDDDMSLYCEARFYQEYDKEYLVMDGEYGQRNIPIHRDENGKITLKAGKVPLTAFADQNDDIITRFWNVESGMPMIYFFTGINVSKNAT